MRGFLSLASGPPEPYLVMSTVLFIRAVHAMQGLWCQRGCAVLPGGAVLSLDSREARLHLCTQLGAPPAPQPCFS